MLPWSLSGVARAELLISSFTSDFSCSLSLTNCSKWSCRGRQRVCVISLMARCQSRQHICKEVATLWSSTDSFYLTVEEKEASAVY